MKTQVLLWVLLLVIVLVSLGCSHPGKTAQEVHRDHLRMFRINNQQMMRDLDRWVHFDQPSKLTERKIP